LRDWLAREGWDDVFLDLDPERGIAAGERWERALHEHANRCEAVIFLVSANWLASGWCLREYARAPLWWGGGSFRRDGNADRHRLGLAVQLFRKHAEGERLGLGHGGGARGAVRPHAGEFWDFGQPRPSVSCSASKVSRVARYPAEFVEEAGTPATFVSRRARPRAGWPMYSSSKAGRAACPLSELLEHS